MLESALCNLEIRKNIRKLLTSRPEQLRSKRTEHTIEGYATSAYADAPLRQFNSIQNQKGFDVTNHMRGEVPYSSLRILHIPFIREELEMRGVIFDIGWSIKKLATALKKKRFGITKRRNSSENWKQ